MITFKDNLIETLRRKFQAEHPSLTESEAGEMAGEHLGNLLELLPELKRKPAPAAGQVISDVQSGRPNATADMLENFEYSHLPPALQAFSRPLCELANTMVLELPMGAELVAGLRKLLEAKDCFVRAARKLPKDPA